MNRPPLPLAAHERLIFALDVPGHDEAIAWVDRLGESVAFYKIGMELLASGDYFSVLDELARRDGQVDALHRVEVPVVLAQPAGADD